MDIGRQRAVVAKEKMKPTTNILRRIFHFFLFVASMPLHSIDCKLSNILMIKGERSPFCWHLKKVHLDRCRELLLLLLLGTETIQAEWGRRWICRGHFADRYVFSSQVVSSALMFFLSAFYRRMSTTMASRSFPNSSIAGPII